MSAQATVPLLQAIETQTHRWHLYVRGINGDDISHIIKKARARGSHACKDAALAAGHKCLGCAACQVVFNLHPTFPNPTREIAHHPFALEETGWGEFELSVVVRLPVSLPHAVWQQKKPAAAAPALHNIMACCWPECDWP